jgi:hypothetical protein
MSISRAKLATVNAVAIAFLLSLLVYSLTAPATANVIKFSDYGLSSQQISVYNSSALIGVYNSNESLVFDGSQNYVIVLKPSGSADYLSDPVQFINLIRQYIPTLLEIGVLLFILLGMALILKKVLD